MNNEILGFKLNRLICNLNRESLMKKIHNKARVHGMFIMLGLATVGYIITVMEGKRALRRGESIDKVNEQMHERYRKMYGDQGANK